MGKNISRRDFLKGSAVSALSLAAMGVLGGSAIAESATEGSGTYTPGTYTAIVYGYESFITVSVTFDETSIIGCEIDASGETPEIGQTVAAEYAQLLVESQDVDAITSATASQTMPAVRRGVQNCIDQAANGAAALDESATPAAATPEGANGYSYEQLTDGNGGLAINAGDETALGTAPAIDPSKVVETLDADVVVVGAGITGIAAARSAAEAGAKVIVLEKNASIEIHGFQCGVLNSSIQKELDAEEDAQEVLHEFQRRSAGRANMQLASLWAHHSGEVFDWYYGAVENPDEDMQKNVTLAYYPRCKEHDRNSGLCKTFLGTIDFKEDQANPLGSPYWIAVGQANQEKAEEAGAQFIFNTPAIRLLTREDGSVNGVIGKDADGNFHQVNAKSVILTTGGFCQFGCGSEAMHKVYAPTLYKNYVAATGSQPQWEPMFSVNPGPISGDTGDGQLMAVWAGAAMDPYGDVAMGSAESGIGGTVALCVNQNGERFWNEDMGIWEKHDQLMYQPGRVSYDIIDVNWRDHLPYQETGHRNFQVTDQLVAVGWTGTDYINNFHKEFLAGVGNPDGIVPSLDPHAGTVWGAETLEELADMIKVPKETFLETVKRYNELAENKEDTDFGCDPQKLFPIKDGPFFACQATAGPAMAAYAGVVINGHLQVLRKDGSIIPGLYAAGNCAGGKFSPSYSTLLSGMNHGLGITHGYYAGLYATENANS